MEKRALALLIFVSIALFSLSSVSAANETFPGSASEAIQRGYTCLENQVKDNTKLSLQQAIFATLALGSKSNLQDVINGEKRTDASCWPKAGCTIKDTAQVALAYQRIGKSTTDIERWLISRNATASDLTWYLQIDIPSRVSASCDISIDGQKRKVKVNSDMKISDNSANSCFSISSNGYWLVLKNSCVDKSFDISCDADFVTSLAYERGTSGTLYVPSESHASASLGTTSEKVNAKCFKTGNTCDYEGSLWAALALSKTGKDIAPYVPYLLALAENNQKYFPGSFLYLLAGGNEQYGSVLLEQRSAGYWEIVSSPYGRYYDTSLGILSLGSGSASVEIEKPKDYLLNVQTKEGCWNNRDLIRDTAFVLYAGWPKTVAADSSGGSTPLCEEVSSQSCEIGSECIDSGGRILNNFACTGFGVCCSVKVKQQTCNEKKGSICASGQECNGRLESSADGSCCVEGSCVEVVVQNTCEQSGGRCASSCDETLETSDSSLTCASTSQLCCMQQDIPPAPASSKLWIYLLSILIILVILAIVFRHKLQIWWFNMNHRSNKGASSSVRPSSPPPGSGMRLPPRPISYGAPPVQPRPMIRPGAPPPKRQLSDKENDIEETLKKIKEMSK